MREDRVYLGLGSNLGDRLRYLELAVERIARLPVTKIIKWSSVYESEPVGCLTQDNFLNMAVRVSTKLTPEEFLQKSQKIENSLYRARTIRWGPRTIDIDLLFWGQLVLRTDTLQIPHPEVDKRNFVLLPLAELAPEFTVPVTEVRVEALSTRSGDASRVELFLAEKAFEFNRDRG